MRVMDFTFFSRHKTLSAFIIVSAVLLLASFLLISVSYGRLAQSVVLHFDIFHGVDLFGARASVWWIWFLGFAMVLVNDGLAYEFYHRERFLSYLFLGANMLISLFVLVALGVIVSIN